MSHITTISVPIKMKEEINALAERRGISASSVIKIAVSKFLEAENEMPR